MFFTFDRFDRDKVLLIFLTRISNCNLFFRVFDAGKHRVIHRRHIKSVLITFFLACKIELAVFTGFILSADLGSF